MNILSLVSYTFLPPKMGGQKGIALFNEYLGARISLHCVCPHANDPVYARHYSVSNILSDSKTRYANPFYFFKLRKIIRERRISHLVLEHPYYGWLALLLKWFTGVKLVVHSHNIESTRFRSMGKWWWGVMWHYEKFVHSQADINFFIQENDRAFAVSHYKLKPEKCHAITYGIEMDKAPSPEERAAAKASIRERWGIGADEQILLFNGTLDYKPNREALDLIIGRINPQLMANPGFRYRIIICGNRLPAVYQDLKEHAKNHIIYAGFVDDISLYFKGADTFINPVIEGGGIKTKLVEALGYGLAVVSTESGAIGIPASITGENMRVTADGDWDGFATQVMGIRNGSPVPGTFFDWFYWGNIAKKAAAALAQS